MKILILTNYFTPDLSAGSFRMQALVNNLEKYKHYGLEVEIVTTMPNRYSSYKISTLKHEDLGWLKIHRIEMPGHKNGMFDQSVSFTKYMMGAMKIAKHGEWNAIFATSSRLMTAVLASRLSRKYGIPLYLDIRDLFVDNLNELFPNFPFKLAIPFFKKLEKYAFTRASRISLVSPGFKEYMEKTSVSEKLVYFTNGIDDIFLESNFSKNKNKNKNKKPLILYAGNIGVGQALEKIIPAVASKHADEFNFRIVGSGSQINELCRSIDLFQCKNVEIIPAVSRPELIKNYQEADILFLHLNDFKAFQKVLPSKIFEYAATKKLIIGGLSGYAEKFISSKMSGVLTFEPCNIDEFSKILNDLEEPELIFDRSNFFQEYSRKNIMEAMAEDLYQFTHNFS